MEIYLLALALALACGLAFIMRRFRQPLIVSYLLAGAIISIFGLVRPQQWQNLSLLPEIGFAFLLFLVGMELDLGQLRSLGKNILFAALAQVAMGGVVLLWVLRSFGITTGAVLIGALALTFSSTILIVKFLLEKGDLGSLHGKLAIGVTLTEDLVAVVLLMFLGFMNGQGSLTLVSGLLLLAKAAFLIWLALFSGKKVLPRVFRLAADNSELLFLTALGWCLIFVSVATLLGTSLGIGAFLAGISLAQSVYRVQISGKIKPLRDFFIMIFFINLGATLSLSAITAAPGLVLILVLYVIVVKPVIFLVTLSWLRFRSHTAFRTAVLMSSISEFSLVILFQAGQSGLFPTQFVSPVVLAAVVSFICSSLLIAHSHRIYTKIDWLLKKIERKETLNLDFIPEGRLEFKDHAILAGCHRSGMIILSRLRKLFGENVLVLDFNPEVVEQLRNDFVSCLFGDIADLEVQERLNLKEAKLVVSTVRDLEDNLAMLDALEKVQSKAVVIVTANSEAEAIVLYERGAHHVSLPLALEGASISRLISDYQDSLLELAKDRERKLGELRRQNA